MGLPLGGEFWTACWLQSLPLSVRPSHHSPDHTHCSHFFILFFLPLLCKKSIFSSIQLPCGISTICNKCFFFSSPLWSLMAWHSPACWLLVKGDANGLAGNLWWGWKGVAERTEEFGDYERGGRGLWIGVRDSSCFVCPLNAILLSLPLFLLKSPAGFDTPVFLSIYSPSVSLSLHFFFAFEVVLMSSCECSRNSMQRKREG